MGDSKPPNNVSPKLYRKKNPKKRKFFKKNFFFLNKFLPRNFVEGYFLINFRHIAKKGIVLFSFDCAADELFYVKI